MDTFIRSDTEISVLQKVRSRNEPCVSEELHAGRYFGFHTRVTWEKNNGTLQTADGSSSFPVRKKSTGNFDTKVYIAHGECWIERDNVARNARDVDRYKVLIPRSGNPGGTILGKPKVSEPGTCSSNTYNVFILDDNREEADNLVTYLKTRFVRYLVAIRTSTQDMAPKSFEFVPLQDWSRPWNDSDLYEKYGLTDDEISAIEAAIPAMD